jgi:HemY protein
MLKFLILIAIVFAIALGFHWLKDTSGEVSLTIGDTAYAVDLTTAVIAAIAAFVVIVALFWFVREVLRAPWRMAHGWRRRNVERGRHAISQGLIAVAAGDMRSAEWAAAEAARRTPNEPLTLLLKAQAAQLRGDRAAARDVFRAMTGEPATRIAGLRGLYVEAEREGELEAARQIAEQARSEAPSSPWAARALLRHQTAAGDWAGALRTLSGAADARLLDKRTARRHRAVVLAAEAMDREEGDPDAARHAAFEAHELAPDLVPAAVVAGRLAARQGDVRRAVRILETTWKAMPHPEIAEAYLHVRAGDAASDRLKRAESLLYLRPQSDEGRLAVALAAIDARDFGRAREVLTPVLTQRPTRRALMIMAELEEAETGDSGRAREWMARAARAPRDPAWTADGVVLESWAPVSPVTGRIDAVEWKTPVTEIAAPLDIQPSELQLPPPAPEMETETEAELQSELPGLERTPPGPAAEMAETTEAPVVTPPATIVAEGDGGTAEPAAATGEPAAVAGATKRTNGSGGAATVHGVAPVPAAEPAAAEAPAETEPLRPPIPDDPGVPDEDRDREERRSRRLF